MLRLLTRAAAKRDDLRHIGVGRDGEGRDLRSRLRHATRDGHLRRRQLDNGDVPAGIVHRPGRRSRHRTLNVLPRDPSAGAGPGDVVEREAELHRGPPRNRRRIGARAGRRRAVRGARGRPRLDGGCAPVACKPRDRLADGRRLALGDQDRLERPVVLGLEDDGRLVGLDLHQRLAAPEAFAGRLQPTDDDDVGLGVGQLRHRQLAGH